jgi:alpha-L-fucosidase
MTYNKIPIKEYEQLATVFNPIYFDAEEWVKLAKEAGMQYIIFTSKHQEGFCMFKSEVDSYNVVDATPFGRDVVGELAEACYKYGLQFGLYYSQEVDWHHPHAGGYTHELYYPGEPWDNDWDFPDKKNKDYTICFNEKIKPQVTEILKNYGDLCLIWFDVPNVITPEQSLELRDLVKHYQPDCLINSRIGNGAYDYVSFGDNEYPDEMKEPEKKVHESGDRNRMDGFKESPYGLYETAGTLNNSWGFNYHDHNWVTPEEVIARRNRLNGFGANFLLNVGPDGLGRIPSFSREILLASKLEK